MSALLFYYSALNAIIQLYDHGKMPSFGSLTGFFGRDQWVRKYADVTVDQYFIPAPKNLYYRLFAIKYKEAFPLSATALVFLTDFRHALQFAGYLLLALVGANSLTHFFVLFIGMHVVFNVVYSGLPRFVKLFQK